MPEQTFQYFVPVGSTSVSITAAFFGAGGVTLDVETTQQAVGVNSPVITPNFTLANTAPSASTHGTDYGDTAVGRLHMLSRMYTPGTTQNFMVSADVVDPSGIDHVEVWCHGSSASSSTVSKNAVGVQGYNFNMFFPAGVTSNGTTKVYAKLVPVNGSSRVINKDIRCVNPNVLVVNPGDLTNNDIASVVGFQSGGTYEDNRLVKLTTGNYIISQGVKGATNGYWNEVRAHEDNTGPVNVEPIIVVGNPGITQERGGARASIRLEWCVFEGVTLDVGRGPAIRADDGGRYLGYSNCTIWDSWTDLDNGGRTYGAASNELVQYLFDEYSGDGSVIARHEVHNTKINASNAGGACEYMNVSANCDWDVMFLNLNWNTDGRISGRSIFDDGLSINKLENMGGDRAMHQRRSDINYLLVTGMTSDGTDTTIHVENPSGGTFSWDLSANSYVRDAGSSADDYYGRGDYMLDYWKGDGGTGATAEAHAVETRKRLYHPNNFIRLYGSSADMAHRIVALNEDYTTTGLTVGDSILSARWYHPDSFQAAGDSGTPVGVTVDNVLVQDYRVYQNHQPMLFNNFGVKFDNVVFSNCSFEQYTIPAMDLLAQIRGTPRRMAMKYCSLPTTLSLAFRTSHALWIPPIRFIADSCVFKHITLDDLGATMDNTWFNNCSYVRATNFDGSGATFDGSTKQDEGFYDITDGGNITRFGVPTSSVKTSITKGLPFTLTGTERGTTREIGAYEVGDTPIGYAGAIKLRVFAGGDIGGIQLINYEGFTLGQEYSVKAIDSHLGYNGSGSTTGINVNWTGSGLTLGNTTGSTASFTPTNASWTITAATGDLIDASIRIQQLTYLTPGTGFTAPEAAIAPIGVSGATGYDCTAIARWDVVPWQVPTDEFMVGVVAYHREGIDKVQFALNGGAWVDVTHMTMNQRTNQMEFCAALKLTSIPNDDIEVRARVIPTVGIPRILAGGISGSAGINTGSLNTGNHSMFLLPLGTTGPEFFVSPSGSDATGDGTRGNPYQTISYAAYYGAGGGANYADVGGMVLTLLPGGYTLEQGTWPRTSLGMTSGWLTIRSDSGTPSSSTQLTGWSTINSWDKVHLQGLQIVVPDPDPLANDYGSFVGGSNNYLWKDNCDVQGRFVEKFNFMQWIGGQWATDCQATDVFSKPFGTVITRNCDADGMVVDAFGSESLLLSSSVRRLSRNLVPNGVSLDYHGDVWQAFNAGGVYENVIVRDLVATDQIEGQGIFLAGNTVLFKDIMFLNCKVKNNATLGSEPNYHVCFNVKENLKHVLLYSSEMWNGSIADVGAPWGTVGDWIGEDVVFKSNLNTDRGTYFLPQPDGPGSGWNGTWPGTLPWTSPRGATAPYPGTNILYLE
jgi:hypothetical protein